MNFRSRYYQQKRPEIVPVFFSFFRNPAVFRKRSLSEPARMRRHGMEKYLQICYNLFSIAERKKKGEFT